MKNSSMIEKVIKIIKDNRSIILYLIFGVLSTIVSIGVYALCTRVFSMGYYSSNIISWICAVTFAFLTNRKLVFDSQANTLKKKIREFVLFYIARIVTLVLELVLLYVGIQMLKINDLVVKIFANILVILLNYLLSKFFVFFYADQKKENLVVDNKNIFNVFKKYKQDFGTRRAMIKTLIWKMRQFEEKLDKKATEKYRVEWEAKEKKCHELIDNLVNDKKYKHIFVFYPYTEWNLPIFQRPQQIALALTENRDDVLYFFCTANCMYDKIELIDKLNDNLYVTTEYEYLMKLKTDKRVLHLYSTDIVSDIYEIEDSYQNGDKILYEYIDEIHEDITQSIPKQFMIKHKQMLKNENYYIVTTADKLYDDVKEKRSKNFILATNGVKVEDFTKENTDNVPEKIQEFKGKYEKIICYYGALAKWFDYELLEKCAKKYPKYCFLLIGIEYDKSLKESGVLERNKNIEYIGKVDYSKLVLYAKSADLLTIPFLINDVTKSTSPVKLFEYMALQVPILTTDLPECRKYQSVNIGKNHEDYIKKIASSIKLGKNEEYKKLEIKEANENSWKKKADNIIDLIK